MSTDQIFLLLMFFVASKAQERDLSYDTYVANEDNFNNNTLLYLEELRSLQISTQNITSTVLHVDALVTKVKDAADKGLDHITISEVNGDQKFLLKTTVDVLHGICKQVLFDVKNLDSQIKDIQDLVINERNNTNLINKVKNDLSEYQLLLNQDTRRIKIHQKYLNSLNIPNLKPDKHAGSNQSPEQNEILDHLIYKYYPENGTSTVKKNADKEATKERLVSIVKYYDLYVPSTPEEKQAPTGLKPTKDQDVDFKPFEDAHGENEAFKRNSNPDGHLPLPDHYPNAGTSADSEAMKKMVKDGKIQVHENLDRVTPLVEGQTTTTSKYDVTNDTKTEDDDDEDDMDHKCGFDPKIVAMIVLFSLTPFVIVGSCMYLSFCRKHIQKIPDSENVQTAASESKDAKEKDSSPRSKVSNVIKISMLPQK